MTQNVFKGWSRYNKNTHNLINRPRSDHLKDSWQSNLPMYYFFQPNLNYPVEGCFSLSTKSKEVYQNCSHASLLRTSLPPILYSVTHHCHKLRISPNFKISWGGETFRSSICSSTQKIYILKKTTIKWLLGLFLYTPALFQCGQMKAACVHLDSTKTLLCCSVTKLFATPWTAASQASLSFTISELAPTPVHCLGWRILTSWRRPHQIRPGKEMKFVTRNLWSQ